MSDVIIVGAGMGGLAAANVLAGRGLSPLVLESESTVGGKAGCVTIDGVEIDTGPSVLTLPEVADTVFRSVGTSVQEQLRLLRPDPSFRYLFPDGSQLDVFHELVDTINSVRDVLGEEAAREFESFLQQAKRIWESAAPSFVFAHAPTPMNVFLRGPSVWLSTSRIDAFRTMQGAIVSSVSNPYLQALLLRYATYNGSDPRQAPATLNCIAHVELALGGFGIDGGMTALVRALERSAVDKGAVIQTDTRVSRIQVERGRVLGVELEDGTTIPARSVVVNAASSHLMNTLLPAKRTKPSVRERSMSGWTAIVRARRQPRVAHTVAMHMPYAEEFEDIFDEGRPPVNPTVYVCAQEVCHGRAGWADEEPLFVMANAPSTDNEQDYSTLREAVLNTMKVRGLCTGEDAIVWERSPWDLSLQFPDTGGNIYGMASHGWRAAFQRPSNRVAGVAGLYMASGSSHPGGGVPLAMQSGLLASDLLCEDRDISTTEAS